MRSNFRTRQPTNHTLYAVFKKEFRQAEVGRWKKNPHGNTLPKYKTVELFFFIRSKELLLELISSKRIDLQIPDWSHFKDIKQIFNLRPIGGL